MAAVWRRLRILLEVHAAAKEALFYPRLLELGVGAGGKDSAGAETRDAIHDHNQARRRRAVPGGLAMTDPAPAAPVDPAAIQAGIAAARAQLLGGRGTGASQAEIDARTRARPRLAGETTSQHLATVARQTAIARGDAAAIALDIATARDQLASNLQAIRARVSPSRLARAAHDAAAGGWAALRADKSSSTATGVALTVAITVLVLGRWRARRSRP